jgi:hypothetical protein
MRKEVPRATAGGAGKAVAKTYAKVWEGEDALELAVKVTESEWQGAYRREDCLYYSSPGRSPARRREETAARGLAFAYQLIIQTGKKTAYLATHFPDGHQPPPQRKGSLAEQGKGPLGWWKRELH